MRYSEHRLLQRYEIPAVVELDPNVGLQPPATVSRSGGTLAVLKHWGVLLGHGLAGAAAVGAVAWFAHLASAALVGWIAFILFFGALVLLLRELVGFSWLSRTRTVVIDRPFIGAAGWLAHLLLVSSRAIATFVRTAGTRTFGTLVSATRSSIRAVLWLAQLPLVACRAIAIFVRTAVTRAFGMIVAATRSSIRAALWLAQLPLIAGRAIATFVRTLVTRAFGMLVLATQSSIHAAVCVAQRLAIACRGISTWIRAVVTRAFGVLVLAAQSSVRAGIWLSQLPLIACRGIATCVATALAWTFGKVTAGKMALRRAAAWIAHLPVAASRRAKTGLTRTARTISDKLAAIGRYASRAADPLWEMRYRAAVALLAICGAAGLVGLMLLDPPARTTKPGNQGSAVIASIAPSAAPGSAPIAIPSSPPVADRDGEKSEPATQSHRAVLEGEASGSARAPDPVPDARTEPSVSIPRLSLAVPEEVSFTSPPAQPDTTSAAPPQPPPSAERASEITLANINLVPPVSPPSEPSQPMQNSGREPEPAEPPAVATLRTVVAEASPVTTPAPLSEAASPSPAVPIDQVAETPTPRVFASAPLADVRPPSPVVTIEPAADAPRVTASAPLAHVPSPSPAVAIEPAADAPRATASAPLTTAAVSSNAAPIDRSSETAARPAPTLGAKERERAEKLVARGERDLADGNVALARQFFHHAATAGLSRGALLLAATYDARELARLPVLGVQPNEALAREWYQRARELGAPEADERLAALAKR